VQLLLLLLLLEMLLLLLLAKMFVFPLMRVCRRPKLNRTCMASMRNTQTHTHTRQHAGMSTVMITALQ